MVHTIIIPTMVTVVIEKKMYFLKEKLNLIK